MTEASTKEEHVGAAAEGLRPGWSVPKPDDIPRSTAWPAAMALAIALVGWGLLASLVMVAVGAVLFVVSIAGWIGEIRHERSEG